MTDRRRAGSPRHPSSPGRRPRGLPPLERRVRPTVSSPRRAPPLGNRARAPQSRASRVGQLPSPALMRTDKRADHRPDRKTRRARRSPPAGKVPVRRDSPPAGRTTGKPDLRAKGRDSQALVGQIQGKRVPGDPRKGNPVRAGRSRDTRGVRRHRAPTCRQRGSRISRPHKPNRTCHRQRPRWPTSLRRPSRQRRPARGFARATGSCCSASF